MGASGLDSREASACIVKVSRAEALYAPLDRQLLCDMLNDECCCGLQAKEEKERQKKEDAAQHTRNRQRAMDAMYGSTSYSRQAALEASIGELLFTALSDLRSTGGFLVRSQLKKTNPLTGASCLPPCQNTQLGAVV